MIVIFFADYKKGHTLDWANDDLKATLVFLTQKRSSGGKVNITGYRNLNELAEFIQH